MFAVMVMVALPLALTVGGTNGCPLLNVINEAGEMVSVTPDGIVDGVSVTVAGTGEFAEFLVMIVRTTAEPTATFVEEAVNVELATVGHWLGCAAQLAVAVPPVHGVLMVVVTPLTVTDA